MTEKQLLEQCFNNQYQKNDKFPILAAFGTVNKRNGDAFTGDYMKLYQRLNRMRLKQAKENKRPKHWTI